MKSAIAVLRIILLTIKLVLWIILIPFVILTWCGKMIVSKLKFRNQLIKSGVPKDWAKKMSRRYTINFRDIYDFVKIQKSKKTAAAE